MATFEFDVETDDGTATIYCDEVAEFTKAMNVTVEGASRGVVGLPKLAGYIGPLQTGRVEGGEVVVRYEEIVSVSAAQNSRFA